MRNFTIKFTSTDKDPFTVIEGTLDNTTTALSICGHNYPNYGAILWTNMVQLLENFAGTTPPKGTVGQLWYSTDKNALQVYDGNEFTYVEGDPSSILTLDNLVDKLTYLGDDYIDYVFPYFDSKYVNKNGDNELGSLYFAEGKNIVMGYNGKVQSDTYPTESADMVTLGYFSDVMLAAGYDITGGDGEFSSSYVTLTGTSKMKPGAIIEFGNTGTIKLFQDASSDYDVANKAFCDKTYLSFKGPNNNVGDITMDGKLILNLDICELTPDDSYEAVCAKWVIEKIKEHGGGGGTVSDDYILKSSSTATTVTNTLLFDTNYYVKVKSVDTSSATDKTSVINLDYADSHYIKKAGDTAIGSLFLDNHPTDDTSTTNKQIPSIGWVNSRLLKNTGNTTTTGGATATKLSTYGALFTVPATQNTEPTSPNQTITLNIPSNTTAIDYEIRFGAVFLATTSKTAVKAKWIVKVNGTPVYTVASISTTGYRMVEPNYHSDEVHSFKYSALANTTSTITVEMYAHVFYTGGVGFPVAYDVKQWVIADPLSATVAIQASSASAGGVTAGPAGNVTYVDFGNGMVMISGMTPMRKGSVTTVQSALYYGIDISFPDNIKLQIPYTFTGSVLAEPTQGKLDQIIDDGGTYITNLLPSSCSVDWMVYIGTPTPKAISTYYANAPKVHWTVTGFKAV